jgi:hypothetical protein
MLDAIATGVPGRCVLHGSKIWLLVNAEIATVEGEAIHKEEPEEMATRLAELASHPSRKGDQGS